MSFWLFNILRCGEPKVWLFLSSYLFETTVSNQLVEIHERPTNSLTVHFWDLFAVA